MNRPNPNNETAFGLVVRTLVERPLKATRDQFRKARLDLRYEPQVCESLKTHVQPGWTCVDVGANVGLLTLVMARLVGKEGRVYAFEPHPENVARLTANVRKYGMERRVRIKRAAVGRGAALQTPLYPGADRHHTRWTTLGDPNDSAMALMVPATSLDEHFSPDRRIDLVKLNVQGAELDVLVGMRRILRDWAPMLIIECHTPQLRHACQRLALRGYELRDLTAADGHTSHLLAIPESRIGLALS